MFDFVNVTLGKLLTVVRRLRTKEVFLDPERNLFLADEEDDKYRVGITAQLTLTRLTEILRDLLPGDVRRSLACLRGKINTVVWHICFLRIATRLFGVRLREVGALIQTGSERRKHMAEVSLRVDSRGTVCSHTAVEKCS